MNFLFDNNLPAPLAEALRLLSKPVAHVRDITELGAAAPDDLIVRSWYDMERFSIAHSRPFMALVQRNGRVFRL